MGWILYEKGDKGLQRKEVYCAGTACKQKPHPKIGRMVKPAEEAVALDIGVTGQYYCLPCAKKEAEEMERRALEIIVDNRLFLRELSMHEQAQSLKKETPR